ncbi:MAG: hypothetical protein ACR2G5_02570 [Pyrinomonadaceae bacterium]
MPSSTQYYVGRSDFEWWSLETMRQVKYRDEQNRLVMMRVGNVADMDRSFDIEFWQSQDDTARFDAAWELVVFAHELKGQKEDELRLQRSVESIERRES